MKRSTNGDRFPNGKRPIETMRSLSTAARRVVKRKQTTRERRDSRLYAIYCKKTFATFDGKMIKFNTKQEIGNE